MSLKERVYDGTGEQAGMLGGGVVVRPLETGPDGCGSAIKWCDGDDDLRAFFDFGVK